MKSFSEAQFPRAIMHLDGDAFFASVEIAKNPALRGKPVVTGRERGIATAISYEAKKFGITRAMPIHEIRKNFPQVIVVESDYESYAQYAERMFAIVRRYTDVVEATSIDECFAELTRVARPLRLTYEEIVRRIQKDIDDELGISVSIGLAPTKVLAKLASKWNKPHGITLIPGPQIGAFLEKTEIEQVWGIGRQTSLFLRSYGLRTAYDFAMKDEYWIRGFLAKPYVEIWRELRGEHAFMLSRGKDAGEHQQSISKTESFMPASGDRTTLYAELSRNIERACHRARELGLVPRRAHVFLKTKAFRYISSEIELEMPTNSPAAILQHVSRVFDRMYHPGTLYRTTGVTLTGLRSADVTQEDLFGGTDQALRHHLVFKAADMLEDRMGRGAVFLASSFRSVERHAASDEKHNRGRVRLNLPKPLSIPMLGEVY